MIGDLPESFINLKQMKWSFRCGTGLSGTNIGLIGELDQLKFLKMNSNNFNREVPREFANLKQAEQLELMSNNFIGSVHEQLFDIKPYVWIKDNNLTSLPVTYWDTPRHMELRGNRLTGVISKEIQASSYFEDKYKNTILPQQAGYGFTLEKEYIGINCDWRAFGIL